jgi:hypothetical protein
MPPVTWLWTVHTAYPQKPLAIFDQKAKLVVWLKSLPELSEFHFFKAPIADPFRVSVVELYELLPDYVPPGEEPPNA